MDSIDPERLARLRASAEAARSTHYAPYSGVLVLAAAETASGALGGGSNVENANYTLTKHAEELAVLDALRADPDPPSSGSLTALYVAGPPPCGSCRQFVAEFAAEDGVWIIERVGQPDLHAMPLDTLAIDQEPLVLPFRDALPFTFCRSSIEGE